MAIPVLDKVWNFSQVNQVQLADPRYMGYRDGYCYTDQNLIYTIKEWMKGWGWTVAGSCINGSYGMDGVDRWTSPRLIYWGTWNPACWIVLKLANCDGLGVGHDAYWMFFCYCNNYPGFSRSGIGTCATSFTPFTGGDDQGNRPTSTTERIWLNSGYWTSFIEYNENSPYNCVLHACRSVDGTITRFFAMKESFVGFYMAFELIKNPTPGWDCPFVMTWQIGNDCPSYGNLNDNTMFMTQHGGVVASAYLSGESHVNGLTAERVPYKNEISGEAHFYPVGLTSDTWGRRGQIGSLYDLWWAHSEMKTGDTYPGDTNSFVTVGKLVMPWPSSTVVLSEY